jgi:hypothetical protein
MNSRQKVMIKGLPIESVVAGRKNEDKIVFTADSDAILTKGNYRDFDPYFLKPKALLLFSKPIWIL